MKVFTIGHSTRPIGDFIALLQEVAVTCVVDVRAIPRSRTNPQFNSDTLPAALAAVGIDYSHLHALGGRRRGQAGSHNSLWRNAAFRNYADYAQSEAFGSGLQELEALASRHCCAIMCAEALWWRCHRRIIADYLLARGVQVAHIMGPTKIDPATLTPGARPLPDGRLLYQAND